MLDGRVELVEFTGNTQLLHCTTTYHGLDSWTALTPPTGSVAPGDPIRVHIPLTELHHFDADTVRQ